MDIKIIVAAHKQYWLPQDEIYLPLQVGAACSGHMPLGYTRDDTGDNISLKNADYCELTGLYWAWKNLQADYIGLVHYRRYFTREEKHSPEAKKKAILTRKEWEDLLQQAPVIVPDKRHYYIETMESQFRHAHPPEALEKTKSMLLELYPAYLTVWDKVMQRTSGHIFNMFVMRRDYYDQYCTWLFHILFALEEQHNLARLEPRIYGFISERLLDVWLEQNGIHYCEQNVSFLERQNWGRKIQKFLTRKFLK